jgi:epoxyqueuosine reductase
MVADNYNFNHNRKPGTLKIARYAWGDDYHKVLEKKMKNILQKMMIIDKNVTGKIYVDTGPVMEKAFAVQSGLGWQGKNSTVIIPEVGSYCFLGTLIINKNIEYNQEKLADRCGDCNRCIQACPTGALEEPYVLNASKCISYFSIEKKGIFSEQESQWLQNWLYGCDICQSVCPWNKKWAKNTPEISYYNRIHLLERSPKEWLDLTEEEFGKLFQKNVIKRLKFDRFRRNLAAALKNL